MIKFYVQDNSKIGIFDLEEIIENPPLKEKIIWVDMISPTISEIRYITTNYQVEFPTKQETEEIEISSRYWEEDDNITINSYFLINEKDNPYNETVSFILTDEFLITIRYKELRTFDECTKKILSTPRAFKDGYYVFSNILDIRIDADADILEFLSREITRLRKQVFSDYSNDDEEILESISLYEDLNMKVRENLMDKQRILSSFLRSDKISLNLKEEVKIMLKDIISLVDYTEFNFERLDYLQNVFVGLLSIEQNKVIKIFTVVSVIFLPPTLIASLYGMNFQFMPELNWKFGYPFAVALMIISSILPIYIFKRKGWL
ncbi:MAG: magnesium/cobalt transporter CorA [Campylobacterales bacterium]|nr:magnesium/cobalt transporter CorA [Campylobacterales bacterium]